MDSEKGELLVSEKSRFPEVNMLPVPSSAPVKWGPDGGVFICGGKEEVPQKMDGEGEGVCFLDVMHQRSGSFFFLPEYLHYRSIAELLCFHVMQMSSFGCVCMPTITFWIH